MSSTSQRTAQFELGVSLSIYLWPALSLAVSQNWGGPDASDKREWLTGSVIELFETDPETDAYDVELRLLQVMLDEFDTNLEDGSAGDVAERILRLRKMCGEGDFKEVEELKLRWESKKGGASQGEFQEVAAGEDDQDTDEEVTDEEEDTEMAEAPELVRAPKEKLVPQVDADGWTTVVSKKKQ